VCEDGSSCKGVCDVYSIADGVCDVCSDDYFRMKLQWKSIDADQESRFSDLKDRRSLVGVYNVSLSLYLSLCLSLCLSICLSVCLSVCTRNIWSLGEK